MNGGNVITKRLTDSFQRQGVQSMIKKGLLLRVKTIADPDAVKNGENLWRVITIIDDAVCLQSVADKMDRFGNATELFWMRRSEMEGNDNLEVVDDSVIPKKKVTRQREGRTLPLDA